jgi:hypothetical protein
MLRICNSNVKLVYISSQKPFKTFRDEELKMFAPIVVVVRRWLGTPEFNKLRGQAIAKHSQVITKVCNALGIERGQRQNMIRLARDNGKRLGLLA